MCAVGNWGPTPSWRRSASVAWERSIAPTTRSWGGTSRSKSCPRGSPVIPNAAAVLRGKRERWPRSIIRTSARSTGSRSRPGSPPWCSSSSRARRWPNAWSAGHCRSPTRSLLPGRSPRHSRPPTRGVSSTAILKPANVVLQRPARSGDRARDFWAKVLDFGLAKSTDETDAGDGFEAPATLYSTAIGRVLGTPAYMSPEQARGHRVDTRTDIWSYGCLLFEMLSGKRAFDGASPADTVAAILEREPDWAALPSTTPESGTDPPAPLPRERTGSPVG